MSTKILKIHKTKGRIVLISGIYLFFVSILLTPFINFEIFSSVRVSTKIFLVVSSALIAIIQLLLYVPRISKTIVEDTPSWIKRSVIAIFGLFLLSILFSPSPTSGLFGMYTTWENNLITYIAYIILFIAWYVHFHLATHLKIQNLIFNTLMALLILTVSAFGILSYHLLDINNTYISNGVHRLSLSFRNPLIGAYFVGMLTNFQLGKTLLSLLKLSEKKKSSKKLLIAIGELVLSSGISYTLLLTYTRSAWISTLLTFILTAFIVGAIKRKKSKKETTSVITRIIISTLLIAAIIVPFTFIHKEEISRRNTDLLMESEQNLKEIADTVGSPEDTDKALQFYQNASQYSSSTIRLLEWKWGIITVFGSFKNILLGTGPDNIYFEMPKYRDPIFNDIPTDASVKPFYIRNIYINFLVERGLVATILVLAIGIASAIAILKAITGKYLNINIIPALSIIGSFFVQGLFYYSTYIPTVLMLFALSFTLVQLTDTSKISLRIPTKTEKSILGMLFVILTTWLIIFYKAETTLAFYKINPLPPAPEVMEKNAKLPLQNNLLKRYLIYYYPDRTSSRTYMQDLMFSKDPDDLRITTDRLYLLAKQKQDTYALQDSIETEERLLQIYSSYPVYWDELGLRYLFSGDFNKAKESFSKALEVKPDYWYAYMHLGETARQECNPEKAIEYYEYVQDYIPSARTEIGEAKQEIQTPRAECK